MSANDDIMDAARSGKPLGKGTFKFDPPLDLTDIVALTGAGAGETILQANPVDPITPHALINLKTTFPGDENIGLPNRIQIADLRIVGNGDEHQEYGLNIHAACSDIEWVTITNCYTGIVGEFIVDVSLRRLILSRNGCNIYIPGSGPNSITTLSILGCQIREARGTGMLIQLGSGIRLDDWTIIESNLGCGLVTQSINGSRVSDLRLGSVWFENNHGGAIQDAAGAITYNTAFVNQ